MELLLGTKGEYIIIDGGSDRISICKKKKNWFDGSRQESIVTFPLSSLEEVKYFEPKFLGVGPFTLLFDSDDNVFRSFSISIWWYNHRQADRMYRELVRYLEFT